LAVVVVVLLLALIGVGGRVLMVSSSARGEISALKAEAAARAAEEAGAEQRLEEEFDRADLPGRLRKVKDLTSAAGRALADWGARGGKVAEIKNVRAARNTCDEAILDYNATAARFPNALLAALPRTIDITDSDTNCGR
jgi:hypothetical protein